MPSPSSRMRNRKRSFGVDNLRFNMTRPGVAESISKRLASNAVNLVPNDRVQFPCLAFHQKLERRGVFAGQFVAQGSHRPRQVVGDRCRQAQIVNGLAAFGDHLIRAVEGLFEFILCFSLWKQII